MPGVTAISALLLLALLSPAPSFSATSPQESSTPSLGKVEFPTSCTPAAQKTVQTGVALLHSFQYQQVEQAFTQAAGQDPHCAIAYWGKAMGLYHQLWDFPSEEILREGLQDVQQGQKIDQGTARERAYIAAAAAFYQNNPKLSHLERRRAYSQAMAQLHQNFPNDDEGAAFYALSLVPWQGKAIARWLTASKLSQSCSRYFISTRITPAWRTT